MKFLFKIVLVLIFVLNINESMANTLIESLNSAYLSNPKLKAVKKTVIIKRLKSTVDER